MSWFSENKQKIRTRALVSEYKQTIGTIRLDQKISGLTVHSDSQGILRIWWTNGASHRTAWSLYLEEQTPVSLLQRHPQCDGLPTLIALPTSEPVLLPVHVQLVSLLQWHLPSMRWSTRPHRPTYQWTWSNVHVQLVSLLQWHLSSMRWPTRSHRPTYQWTGPPTSSRATSEPASMARPIVSLLQRHERDKLCYMRVVETDRQWACFKGASDIDLVTEPVTR